MHKQVIPNLCAAHAAAECRKSKVFNEKFQLSLQLSVKTFDFL